MKHQVASTALAVALGLGSLSAQAQTYASTAQWVNLRAGPSTYYPVVAVVPPSVQVAVFGCLGDYSWCDVAAGPQRGWISSPYLLYPYQNGYAPLSTVGAVIGIAALVFILDDYWHDHYRHRSWYPERQRWSRPPPRFAGPPRAVPPRPESRAYVRPAPPGPSGPPARVNPQRRGMDAAPPGQRGRDRDEGPPGQRRRDDNGPPGQRGRADR